MISSILQYKLKMHYATYALIIGKILGVFTIAMVALNIKNLDQGFFLIIAAGIITHGIMLVFSMYYASKHININLSYDFAYWKSLLTKSLPYGLALILGTIYFKIDVTFLSLFRTQTEVGLYGVPLRMIEVLIVLPMFFMNSIMATFTRAVSKLKEQINNQANKEKVNKIFSQLIICSVLYHKL